MISSNSTFVRTDIAVPSTAIKSLIFRFAELLFTFAAYKVFSLIAAIQKSFTSYLVFSENPIQKAIFVFSRGVSKESALVVLFTVSYIVAELYGTVLWALDAPGVVAKRENITANTVPKLLLDDPSYIIHHSMKPEHVNLADEKLTQLLSVNLFEPGANITLTGEVERGTPETVPAPLNRPGKPRIWLEDDGFSVTVDSTNPANAVIFTPKDAIALQNSCITFPISQIDPTINNTWFHNCTFQNDWSMAVLGRIVGLPEIHWDFRADDSNMTSSRILPRAGNDLWHSVGSEARTGFRYHMFTVTKGTRRHTFLLSAGIVSLVAMGGTPIPGIEMKDIISRTATLDPAEQKKLDKDISAILQFQLDIQARNQSGSMGTTSGQSPTQVVEAWWEMLSLQTQNDIFMRVFRFIATNITLVRSETISPAEAPIPYDDSCEVAFMNHAFGGKVDDTDCSAHGDWHQGRHFLGQTDTSAVINIGGLTRKSAPGTSSDTLDPALYAWFSEHGDIFHRMLLSRGYILSLDPGLVTLEISRTKPAISYLQILLVVFAGVFAGVSWGLFCWCASGHWGRSLLVNLVMCTGVVGGVESWRLGYCFNMPNLSLVEDVEEGARLKTDTGIFQFVHQEKD